MLYVGLTEKHKESANMFGSVVGAQVISQMVSSKSFMEAQSSNKSGLAFISTLHELPLKSSCMNDLMR